MAINQNITDEVLLATLIAQNGDNKGRIVFAQTKSCGLTNWNPSTNGDAAREVSYSTGPVDSRCFGDRVSEDGLISALVEPVVGGCIALIAVAVVVAILWHVVPMLRFIF